MARLDVQIIELDPIRHGELTAAAEVWDRWRGDRLAPDWADVVLTELPPPALPFTVVVDLIDGGRDCRYRFWGSGMTRLYGSDETGKRLTETSSEAIADATQRQLAMLLERGGPMAFEVRMPRVSGDFVTKTNLRLPIAEGSGEIGKVITIAQVGPNVLRLGDDLATVWSRAAGG
ncbi:MAG: hypothetical protein OXR84_01085 [Magnetovibrio sp.]|nr:hypothetical protein [Magnetovibrio sp.]